MAIDVLGQITSMMSPPRPPMFNVDRARHMFSVCEKNGAFCFRMQGWPLDNIEAGGQGGFGVLGGCPETSIHCIAVE